MPNLRAQCSWREVNEFMRGYPTWMETRIFLSLFEPKLIPGIALALSLWKWDPRSPERRSHTCALCAAHPNCKDCVLGSCSNPDSLHFQWSSRNGTRFSSNDKIALKIYNKLSKAYKEICDSWSKE